MHAGTAVGTTTSIFGVEIDEETAAQETQVTD